MQAVSLSESSSSGLLPLKIRIWKNFRSRFPLRPPKWKDSSQPQGQPGSQVALRFTGKVIGRFEYQKMIWLVQVFYEWHINFRLRRRAIRFSVPGSMLGPRFAHILSSRLICQEHCVLHRFSFLSTYTSAIRLTIKVTALIRDASSWMPWFEFFKAAELATAALTGLMECSKW